MDRALVVIWCSTAVRALSLALAAGIVTSRIRSTSLKHAVWVAVLAGMLLMPVLILGLQPFHLPIAVRQSARVAKVLDLAPDVGVPPTGSVAPPPPVAGLNGATTLHAPFRWYRLLGFLYCGVSLFFLTQLILAYFRTKKLVAESKAISPERCRKIAKRDFPGRRLPHLRESVSVRVPSVVGVLDPVVLLPIEWRDWDAWKLRAVLAHELTHIRRGDWAVRLAAGLNRCIYWFHPLAWWLERHLARLAEAASDEACVWVTGDAPKYAEVLLQVASEIRGGRRLPIGGVAMARTSNVARRIDRVLEMKHIGSGVLGGLRWVVLAACVAPIVVTASALQVSGPPPIAAGSQEPDALQVLMSNPLHSAAEAQEAEGWLKANPNDLQRRLRLMAYYYLNAMKEPWLEHVFWLIQHHPESKASSSRLTSLSPGPTPFFNSAEDYEQAKALWMTQVDAHPRDPRVLQNAGRFVGSSDPALGEKLLLHARALDPDNAEAVQDIVWLYHSILNHSFHQNFAPPADPALVSHVKNFLETTEEARFPGLVGLEMSRMHFGGDANAIAAEQLRREYARVLIERARMLEPNNLHWRWVPGMEHKAPSRM